MKILNKQKKGGNNNSNNKQHEFGAKHKVLAFHLFRL